MTSWRIPDPGEIPEKLTELLGSHPIVGRILARNGIRTLDAAQAFLYPEHYHPTPAAEIPGLEAAAERLIRAIDLNEKICVWGDFDVDGQTSTTLLVEALRSLGADVFYHIPVRKAESHGLNTENLAKVIDEGASLVLTCDTGSDGHVQIDYANSRGVDVIVTDHHSLSPENPNAAAFVNPQMLPDGHPLKTLPGVAVAYKLVEQLAEIRREDGLAERGLDLVALGIVADVAVQTGDTRYLLQLGMEKLRKTERIGLKALFISSRIDQRPESEQKLDAPVNFIQLNSETIGFTIGPRLNALGRLGDANPIVEFLTTTDPTQAKVFAANLEGLNLNRRMIGEQITEAALRMIEEDHSLASLSVLVLAREGWEPGIIGIVASRLVDQFSRPVIMISIEPDGMGRGSARSVDGINITEAISAQADLLNGFGGHPMAAGLSIDREKIGEFRRRISATVAGMAPDLAETFLDIDGFLSLSEIDFDLVDDLNLLEPFGRGNRKPVLATRNVRVLSQSQIGRSGDHLRIVVEDVEENVQEAVWWGGGRVGVPEGRFDLAFNLNINTFNGANKIQLEWMDARAAESLEEIPAERVTTSEVVDFRSIPDPEKQLDALRLESDLAIWGQIKGEKALGAHDLKKGRALAIWTIPPGASELNDLIERTEPSMIYLFGQQPAATHQETFLKVMIGMLKNVVSNRSGHASVAKMAEALFHKRATVIAGLNCLAARGHFDIEIEGDDLRVGPGSGEKSDRLAEASEVLKWQLNDSAAYRQFYLTADIKTLLAKPQGKA